MSATPAASREALRAAIDARLGPDDTARGWLDARGAEDLDGIRHAMADIGRVLGRKPLVAGFSERSTATLPGVHGPLRVGRWRLDEAGRTWLLATAADRAERPFDALFGLYDLGDTDTRVGALHALNFVADDDTDRGLELVLDAGRTYLDPLLTAAWCDNPFSAKHMSDEAYRSAVLKALFCNVPVDGFLDLESRADPTLAKSLYDYADEREAAGRPVPAAVWIVAALHPCPGLVARLIGRLEHPLPAERRTAAAALANARDARAASFIAERLARETDPEVQAALRAAAEATPEAGR